MHPGGRGKGQSREDTANGSLATMSEGDDVSVPLLSEGEQQWLAAPSTFIEEKVAEIVAALLNVERVGRDENFFLPGVHSMLGAQLVARISEVLGVELPLRTLFEAPTVRQLAAKVELYLIAWLEDMSAEEAQRLVG